MAGLTPSQTVGPFFHYALTDPHSITDLTGPQTRGERIVIHGQVVDGEGIGVPDAMLEIWQANAEGKFDHPEDRQDKPHDPAFRGWGRIATDANGNFAFTTVKPGPVPGPGNTLQAPHILVNLFARGLLKQLVTRIYFDGDRHNDADPILALIEESERRATLLARVEGQGRYRWNVVLQGDDETVFFDV